MSDPWDTLLITKAANSMIRRGEYALSITGECFVRARLSGRTQTECDFDLNAYAMTLEGRSLMKEAAE